MPKRPSKILPPINLGEDSIGQRIALLRKKQGFTQQQLADRIGIQRTVLADYEIARIRLYDEMVARFAIALNVSADKILGLKEKKHDTHKPNLKITKRLRQISELNASNQKTLLKTIDNYLKGARKHS